MLRFPALLFATALAAIGHAADVPTLPTIPPRTFSVTDFGAVGDGTTMNTAAFHAAVEACAQAGGGQVIVPPGNFVTGPFALKSAMDLHLEKGATIRMSPRVEDYPVTGRDRQSFLTATEAHDVAITGEGTIDGQGQPWWKIVREIAGTPRAQTEPRRPQMIVFSRCERVRLAGFHTLNPPNTHCSLRQCQQVTIEGLTIMAPADSPNTDGLNLNIRHAIIRDCRVATGDDNIVFLASAPADGGAPGVEDVVVSHCSLGVGHGLSIGSFTSGGVRSLTFDHITFDGTISGLRLKADRDRGGLVENITCQDITMKGVKFPIYFTSYYPREPKHPDEEAAQPVGPKTPRWRNITIKNATLTDCVNSVIIWGLPEESFSGIILQNFIIHAQHGMKIYHAKDVHFRGQSLQFAETTPLITYDADVDGFTTTPYQPPHQ